MRAIRWKTTCEVCGKTAKWDAYSFEDAMRDAHDAGWRWSADEEGEMEFCPKHDPHEKEVVAN